MAMGIVVASYDSPAINQVEACRNVGSSIL